MSENQNLEDFKEALQTWEPTNHVTEAEHAHSWAINPDGSMSITLHSVLVANLADELLEWDGISDWIGREDCKNWKRSPIARENRRESVVSGNHFSSMQALLGRPWVNLLLKHIASLRKVEADAKDR